MIIRILFVLCMFTSLSWGNWPQFRGPNNDGLAPGHPSLPLEFHETKNVKWKTAIHDEGWSTPVIWDKQIWLTTATEDGHKMYVLCLDRDSGEIQFDKQLLDIKNPRPLGNDVNTYASCSSVIEEGRVYVHFGSYGTACIDTNTFETLWLRTDLPCNHFRGPASSPILFEDTVILTFDGADYQYQCALKKTTGDTVWKTDRNSTFLDLDDKGQPKRDGDFRKAYSTPIFIEVDGNPRMIVSASYNVFCYDPRTGKEIWRIDTKCYSNASMALFGHGLIYAITGRGNPELLAIQPGGKGNITDSSLIQWRFDKGIPSMPSPVLVGDLIYFVNNGGILSCVEAKTGKLVWKTRLSGQYYASPIVADGKLFFTSTAGDVTIIQLGRSYNALKTNKFGSGFMASPAVSGNALYLRSKTHLYRIEKE
ncbi:PQQ-binding-like beta-propeller repeat protein [bacterium]|nr:PQQ-binding-like beta-propeller repeat protein [bacterium]